MSDNSTNNQILNAIEILVNSSNSNLKFDKTIETEIINIADAAIGEYRVRYQATSFIVYEESSDIKPRQLGEHVYVLVPEGDFNKKKVIMGKAIRKSNNDLIDYKEEKNLIEETGRSVESTYNINVTDELGLKKAEGTKATTVSRNIFTWVVSDYDLEFQKYYQNAEAIIFSADFRTNISSNSIIGTNFDYGLEFVFETVDG